MSEKPKRQPRNSLKLANADDAPLVQRRKRLSAPVEDVDNLSTKKATSSNKKRLQFDSFVENEDKKRTKISRSTEKQSPVVTTKKAVAMVKSKVKLPIKSKMSAVLSMIDDGDVEDEEHNNDNNYDEVEEQQQQQHRTKIIINSAGEEEEEENDEDEDEEEDAAADADADADAENVNDQEEEEQQQDEQEEAEELQHDDGIPVQEEEAEEHMNEQEDEQENEQEYEQENEQECEQEYYEQMEEEQEQEDQEDEHDMITTAEEVVPVPPVKQETFTKSAPLAGPAAQQKGKGVVKMTGTTSSFVKKAVSTPVAAAALSPATFAKKIVSTTSAAASPPPAAIVKRASSTTSVATSPPPAAINMKKIVSVVTSAASVTPPAAAIMKKTVSATSAAVSSRPAVTMVKSTNSKAASSPPAVKDTEEDLAGKLTRLLGLTDLTGFVPSANFANQVSDVVTAHVRYCCLGSNVYMVFLQDHHYEHRDALVFGKTYYKPDGTAGHFPSVCQYLSNVDINAALNEASIALLQANMPKLSLPKLHGFKTYNTKGGLMVCSVSSRMQLKAVEMSLQDMYAKFVYSEDNPFYPGKRVTLDIKEFTPTAYENAAFRVVDKLCRDKAAKN